MSTQDDAALREICLDSQQVYKGSFLSVRKDTVRLPSGKTAQREYIVHPGAVVIVALLDDGRVVMERQYRHPMGRVMLELPAGKLDAGEDPLRCGQRELLEETGYRARRWARAGQMHNAIAYSDEVIHIYFAQGLEQASPSLDDGEFLEVYLQPAQDLFAAIRRGDITDAKTITALHWLGALLDKTWSPQWMECGGTV